MSFDVRLSAEARRDFHRAQEYYDSEAPEQTERFIAEFFEVAYRIGDYPYSAPLVRGSARRVGLRVFPYQLWYRVKPSQEVVEVIAVLHVRQDPGYLGDPAR
ncbi:MAG TPA: type II toxin-antitoxin system RelE/ParE family toxin [Arachnia sp.]|nr:type II toxin-antitoxin system RelE/ParE family toxin [Arachnia sp.]HMT87157.1 type II toxin-antitoxin system RelE/ParE family toxin [Arachnia sp.]